MTRLLWISLAVVLLASCAPATHLIVQEIRQDLRWSGEVRIRGDVVVPDGVSIYIEPGAEIIFMAPAEDEDTYRSHPNFPGSELIVRGRLVADGRPDEPITFRYQDVDAPPGSWGGINLEEGAEALFGYCRFTRADSALHSRQATVQVRNCVFEANRVGVRFHSSLMTIENNDFVNNGAAIRFHFGSPVIRRNYFRHNDKAFFITSHPSGYLVEQNTILESNDYQVVLGEAVPDDVLMQNNFWGAVDPASIEESLFDGRRTDYLGKVLYTPFLVEPVTNAGASWNR